MLINQRVEMTWKRLAEPTARQTTQFVLKMGREAIMTPVLMDSIRQQWSAVVWLVSYNRAIKVPECILRLTLNIMEFLLIIYS